MSGVNTLAGNSAALSLLLNQPLQSQINRTVVGLSLLPVVMGTGKSVNFTAQFSGASNASAIADGARRAYSDADNETEVAGTLSWSVYDKVASVSGLNQAATAATQRNFGAASLLGANSTLLQARIRQQYQRLNMGLGAAFYSGSEAATPTALGGIARSIKADTSYAGIDPGTYTDWVSTSDTVTSAALSFDAINTKLLTPIYSACGEKPHALVTTPAIFDKIRALYGSAAVPYIREMEIPAVENEYTGKLVPARKVVLDAGSEVFTVQGIPVIRDKDCTSGKVYAINLKYLQFHVLNPFVDMVSDAQRTRAFLGDILGGGLIDQVDPTVIEMLRSALMNPTGPIVKLNPLGRSGDSDEVQVVAYSQVANTRRQAHGVLAVT